MATISADKMAKKVAQYLVFRFSFDGEPITNLKIQKLLYYVYVWYLVHRKKRCFDERFQAWPIGPVLPSIYNSLKIYKASPIDPDFTDVADEDDLNHLKSEIGQDLLEFVDNIYEKYGTKSAFELVGLTHNALPWLNARKGLDPTQKTDAIISDNDILLFYGKKR